MNVEEHKIRHERLHKHLDELAADYLSSTGRLLGDTSVLELFQWSNNQTLTPDHLDIGRTGGAGVKASSKLAVCSAP